MNNFEYNLSPSSLRGPPRRLQPDHTHDRQRNMTSSNAFRRQKQRPSRQTPPTLSNLPRFHPANFTNYVNSSPTASSASSSNINSPEPQPNSPQGPVSPRSTRQNPTLSEAQRQLYLYHRELFNLNRPYSAGNSPGGAFSSSRPASPNLQPLASPGAVTPLQLEEVDQAEGYLIAGTNVRQTHADTSNDETLEKYVRRETHAANPGETALTQ